MNGEVVKTEQALVSAMEPIYLGIFEGIKNQICAAYPRGIMNIDIGLAVVIVAVLIFYLRLIVVQRQRVKQIPQTPITTRKKKGRGQPQGPQPTYSILSQS
jgi:hypothetical protein